MAILYSAWYYIDRGTLLIHSLPPVRAECSCTQQCHTVPSVCCAITFGFIGQRHAGAHTLPLRPVHAPQMEVFFGLLIGIVLLLLCCILRQQSYWRRRGIPHSKPTLIATASRKHISEILLETYAQHKGTGPFAGIFFLFIKSVLIIDLELVKNILIRDFSTFQDRGLYNNAHDDPLSANLFFLDGDEWKRLRAKLTPTFTTGKMKRMLHLVVAVGEQLVAAVNERIGADRDARVLEVNDLMGRYTTDTIGSCAFGLECNSLRNEIPEFVQVTQSFFNKRRHNPLLDGLIFSYPRLARRLRMRVITQRVHDFYMNLARETVAYRSRSQERRNDFMDLLIDMMGQVNAQGERVDGISIEEIAAQCFIIFLAGYETSSATLGFALYQLAQHAEVQQRLRQEIEDVLAEHSGSLTYECVKCMSYAEQVICETLRMHPIVPHLIRKARARYETSDPKYYIERGTLIIIPSIGIHYDPAYYPQPHTFRPERFTPEEVQKRPACTWLPFGEGPRNCIGLRFGKLQTIVALIQLIRHFKFSVAAETQVPFVQPRKSFLIASENGIRLRVERI